MVGSLVLAHYDTFARSRAEVRETADTVARRVEDVLLTAEAAIAEVAFEARAGCGVELIREFRNTTIRTLAIPGMALKSPDGKLLCTSFGMIDPPLQVEETPEISTDGALIRFSPPIEGEFAPGVHFAAMLHLDDGHTLIAAIAPATLVDVVPPDVLGTDGRISVSLSGVEISALGTEAAVAPDFIRIERPIGLYDASVTAHASREWALAPWRDNALITGGIGALAGLALGLGAAHLGRKRLSFAAELRDGLDNREFEIWYQPVIDLQAGRCCGAEALIRWRHPERDLIPPDLFITLAEETGIIIPMTRWLMQEVGEKMGPLLRSDRSLHIAINLAPAHVASFEIVEDARRTVEVHGIEPSQILFELTERGLIDDPACRRVIGALSDLGSEVAVDDFGTGYSSLAYINKFKLDYLKLDKAFVSAIGRMSPAARLTDVIIDMAKSLGLKIIAEGVETEEQARYLRDSGVNSAQGWFYSRPLTARAFLEFLKISSAPGSLPPTEPAGSSRPSTKATVTVPGA